MKKKVSPTVLTGVMNPLLYSIEDIELASRYPIEDPMSLNTAKSIIENEILDNVEKIIHFEIDDLRVNLIVDSLGYYLKYTESFSDKDEKLFWENIYEGLNPAFYPPENPKILWIHLWNLLTDNFPYSELKLSDYEVSHSIHW